MPTWERMPTPDHRNLGDFFVADHFARADVGLNAFQDGDGFCVLVAVYGEGEVGGAIRADVLDDHVHVNVGFGDRPQDLVGNARAVRYAQHGDFWLHRG